MNAKANTKNNKPSITDHPSKLRHYKFALKYVELNFNGTQAYLATYGEEYKTEKDKEMSNKVANVNAARLLANASVQQYIHQITEAAFEECQISINTVLARYNRWANSNITDVIKWENITESNDDGIELTRTELKLRDLEDIPPNALNCIESLTQSKDGFKLAMVSKKAANDMLFKYLGLDKSNDKKESGYTIVYLDEQDKGLL